MTDLERVRQDIEDLAVVVKSLDARLKVLEEERRVLHEGLLKTREENRRLELTEASDD